MKLALIVVFLALSSTVAYAADFDMAKLQSMIFKEGCLDRFLAFDIDPDCAKFTVLKLIGFAIVCGASILKVPQILKIYASGSVKGISAFSYYIEFISYLGILGNSVRLNLPFSVYGEGVFIDFQNFIII